MLSPAKIHHFNQSPVWFVIGSLLTLYIFPCGPQDHYIFRLGHSELNLHLFLLPGGGPYRMYPYHSCMTPRVFDHQCCWPHSWRVARLRLNTSWEPSPSRFLLAQSLGRGIHVKRLVLALRIQVCPEGRELSPYNPILGIVLRPWILL